MAGQLKHGLVLQGFIKQFEWLSVRGLRHAHTNTTQGIAKTNFPSCLIMQPTSDEHKPRVPPLQASHQSLIFSAFNKTEIREKIKPVIVIETPTIPGIDSSISDPTLIGIKPLENPVSNRIVIKPPSVDTPKSASKNGNQIVLRLRHKKIKRRQLLKTRMKIWPMRKKLNFLKARKRERKLKAELAEYKKEAEAFDFLEIVKKDLAEAKKRGYHYDMFGSGTETFGFGDVNSADKERKNLGGLLKSLYSKEQKKRSK